MKLLFLLIFVQAIFLNPDNVFGESLEVVPPDCPFSLYHTVREGDSDGLELLLEYGVNANPPLSENCFDPFYQSLPEGSTLLHVIAHQFDNSFFKLWHVDNYERMYDLLVEYGADPNTLDINGQRAKDFSLMKCHTDETGFDRYVFHCGDHPPEPEERYQPRFPL